MLENAAQSLGLHGNKTGVFKRAALFPEPDGPSGPRPLLSKKRRKELARQMRKLEELGPVTFEGARTSHKIVDAIEGFMSLELSGWKGRKGTALYNHKKIAAFSRQIVFELATEGYCEIFSMMQNGKPIASLIVLGRDGRLVPWKIAFDERLSSWSPGMQIMIHATEKLRARKNFVVADSLAVADHPMINRIWQDRIEISDFTVALRPEAVGRLEETAAAKQRFIQLKSTAKAALAKLRPR